MLRTTLCEVKTKLSGVDGISALPRARIASPVALALRAFLLVSVPPSVGPCAIPGDFSLSRTAFDVTIFRIFASCAYGLHLLVFLGRVGRTGLTYLNRCVPVLGHSSS